MGLLLIKKQGESLSPDDKVRILTNDAAAHKKQRESQVLDIFEKRS